MADYRIAGIEELQLHHFYRAMAWLGEEIAPTEADALAPRCIKDLIEERLFERRRDLFSDLSLVFMDTTSLSFYGAGGIQAINVTLCGLRLRFRASSLARLGAAAGRSLIDNPPNPASIL